VRRFGRSFLAVVSNEDRVLSSGESSSGVAPTHRRRVLGRSQSGTDRGASVPAWLAPIVTVALLSAGCVTQRTVAAEPERVAPAPPTSVAPPLDAGTPSPPVAEEVEPPPDPHPVVAELGRRAAAWAPAIETEIDQLQLEGTGFADTDRTLAYLRYRFLHDVLLPAMKPSYDRTVRAYREALERAALFDDSYPLANLQTGSEQPAACERCVAPGTACSPLCEHERRRLRPATLAASGLDAGLAFAGPPRGGELGASSTENVPFERFLDAAVEAGLPRAKVEIALGSIVTDVVRRCRGLEGALAVDDARGVPGHRALLLGYLRWDSTYARDREPAEVSADPIVVDPASHLEAWNRFEQAIMRHVPVLRRHAVALRRYREQLIAAERGTAPANTFDERPAMDCTTLRPDDARRCAEVTVGLHGLDLQVAEAVLAGDALVAPEVAVRVGLSLEHLSLGELQTRVVEAAFVQLLSDLSQRGSPRTEL
jgi:hypothetical protein